MVDQTIKKKVLAVDDEIVVRRLVRDILSKDYVVLEASNGEEAVNMAHSQKPDLILMDMMMPKMDGLTACCAIKQNPTMKDIPIVMLTAIGYDLNKKVAEDVAGVDAYMIKPFDLKTLLSTVRHLLSLRSQTSEEARDEYPNNMAELKE
jgi:two-component system, OmpR family, alkaline phosphatase synthesis response regulator PhoP